MGIADSVPIVMAGGVWRLDEWDHWIDNPELGQIVFQFGTRPLLTQESPIPPEWKARLLTLEEGDVLLHRFSPTGFYSSAVRNPFLRNLEARSERQIAYTKEPIGDHHFQLDVGVGTKKNYWVTKGDLTHAREWFARGYTNAMKTPDDTLIFVQAGGRETDPHRPGRVHGLPFASAPFPPGRTMRRIRRAALPTHAASASKRRSRTSLTAVRWSII